MSSTIRVAGEPGASVRRQRALPHGNGGDEDGELHRVDEIGLLHFRGGESSDVCAMRVSESGLPIGLQIVWAAS